ncbi:Fms-interacting protein-domain-containing protein [Cokeromyces recurvatus]|uniref:Fms-interacting protein-domain-containing protein n=1 Tax=Cokeromyces recurvatus TaxID=90255 RepID=UPI00221ECDC0|nr:Fms-interacting protein-domain-containing protein [Cokeromyces recurvatus]KAI7900454.1 Fms-interacting protein-domain-containing protein [Cokeromyces recurvatus]
MTLLNSQIATLQETDAAARQLESILVTQFNKKINETLEEEEAFDLDYDLIGENFAKLKDIQVNAYNAVSDSKQATVEAKNYMNEKQAELHDVMFEKRHILEEIVKCREFRSVYQDVELIPLDEFNEKAGPEYLENSDNPHQLFINRLKYELVVRTDLKEKEEVLKAKRTQLVKENRKAQKMVDQFDKLLDDFVQAAIPLEEALEAEMKKQEDANVSEALEVEMKKQDDTNVSEVLTPDTDLNHINTADAVKTIDLANS